MPEWVLSDWALRAVEILLPAVIALAGAALTLGAVYLQRRAEAIKHERVRQLAQDTIWRAKDAVAVAVAATLQTFVAEAKARAEDGKLTPEEAQQARDIAWLRFKHIMGDKGLEILSAITGDVAAWFNSELEAAVHHLKAQRQAG